jgi:hypothetical protein
MLPDFTGGGANYRQIFSPLVHGLNEQRGRFHACYFAPMDDLSRADVIMVMKHLESFSTERLTALKRQGKILIFELIDNPAGCQDSYHACPEKLKLFDLVMAWSPVQVQDLQRLQVPYDFIGPAIANRRRRRHWNETRPLTLVWQGFPQNAPATESLLNPILGKLAEEHEFTMIYHGATGTGIRNIIYRSIAGPEWESVLLEADVGVVVKDLTDAIQYRKPYNKILSYMAAGLTTICTPTPADQTLMEDGKTGLFAYSADDWHRALKFVLTNRESTLRLARQGMERAWSAYTPAAIAKRYSALFERLIIQAV